MRTLVLTLALVVAALPAAAAGREKGRPAKKDKPAEAKQERKKLKPFGGGGNDNAFGAFSAFGKPSRQQDSQGGAIYGGEGGVDGREKRSPQSLEGFRPVMPNAGRAARNAQPVQERTQGDDAKPAAIEGDNAQPLPEVKAHAVPRNLAGSPEIKDLKDAQGKPVEKDKNDKRAVYGPEN